MNLPISRRRFNLSSLEGAAAVAIGVGVPGHWMQTLAATLSEQRAKDDRILVVIQLTGGNDGLNTIIPFADERYQKARPKLAISASDVLSLNSETGLHPFMRGIASLLEERKFCIVNGVGYPNPNRSHFESMDIWHSCQRKESRSNDGWLGRLFASNGDPERTDSFGLHLGTEQMPLALAGRGVQTPSLATVEQLRWKGTSRSKLDGEVVSTMSKSQAGTDTESSLLDFVSASTSAAMQASKQLDKAMATPDKAGDFPDSQLGEKLKVISRLILAGIKTQVYYVTLDGFDTHANQLAAHASLVRQWSDALTAFHKRLADAGDSDRVLVFTFSEFGRRVTENASQGTDHGAAAPAYLSGPNLGVSMLGEQPNLSDLDDGDVKFHTDFRCVYATILEDWLGLPSKNVLLGDYPKLVGLKFS
ncbi:MAG: DUF1501 domain-containing protein [Planctomycetota bacterium]|nr:DUF1501 domain-containing protein [Planctomycetota bacterium]